MVFPCFFYDCSIYPFCQGTVAPDAAARLHCVLRRREAPGPGRPVVATQLQRGAPVKDRKTRGKMAVSPGKM